MIRALALGALLLMPVAAQADTLLSSDFQDNKTTRWAAMGEGDVRLSTYAGNVSLKLTAGTAALTAVSTAGYKDVTITVSFAALTLGTNGACIADVSTDGGANWTELYRVSPGQDDGVTLHSATRVPANLADQKKVVLRLRALGGQSATCWADNITITATKADATPLSAHLDDLLNPVAKVVPVSTTAFAPPANSAAATNTFEGRLVFGALRPGGGFTALFDPYDYQHADGGAVTRLPPFDYAFVQSGDALIPVQRGPIANTDPGSEYVLEPGRVWNEAGDAGYSRAAIPFALEERNANCVHNGLLTFLFKSDGSVSDVAFQIGSETCKYFKYNQWSRIAARYVREPVPNAVAIRTAYAVEMAARLPVKPIETLATADPSKFGDDVDPAAMTLYGVLMDGVNYVGGCNTRFGPYPYCDVMDLPSYSLAKSVFVGIGSMRLAQLYPGVMQEHLAAYVPECAVAKTWDDVTFQNMLDMASGHYNSDADQADEDGADIAAFFNATDHAGHIHFSCTHYPRKANPGTRWVYHTADTYALGSALNAYVKQERGPSADVYRDIVTPIWHELNLSPPIDVTRRTYDAVAQPFTGWGLTFHRDDIVRIARFLNNENGEIAGKPVLNRKMLDAALQRSPADFGLRASTADFRYHNGYWAWNAARAIGCAKPAWIPFMSGFGGIIVAMMPNGMTYYYFSDGGTYAWADAAAEANRIRPFCEK